MSLTYKELTFIHPYIGYTPWHCDNDNLSSNEMPQDKAQELLCKINSSALGSLGIIIKSESNSDQYVILIPRNKISPASSELTDLAVVATSTPEIFNAALQYPPDSNKRKAIELESSAERTDSVSMNVENAMSEEDKKNVARNTRTYDDAEKVAVILDRAFEKAQLQLSQPANIHWAKTSPKTPRSGVTEQGNNSYSIQGSRRNMEDVVLEKTSFLIEGKDKTYPVTLYAVFDGHTSEENQFSTSEAPEENSPSQEKTPGRQWADFLAEKLPQHLEKELQPIFQDNLSQKKRNCDILNVLKQAFYKIHLQCPALKKGGTTACVAMIIANELWVANMGDSRAVLNVNGKPIALSRDHKAKIEDYAKSLRKRGFQIVPFMGGKVILNTPLEQGAISITNCIGHEKLLNPRSKVIHYPLEQLKGKNSHLIIASDGLWDVASPSQVTKHVEALSRAGFNCQQISKLLAETAYAISLDKSDNTSVIVVDMANAV